MTPAKKKSQTKDDESCQEIKKGIEELVLNNENTGTGTDWLYFPIF